MDELVEKSIEEVDDYAIYLLDKEGNLKSWNKGAQRIKGYSSSEVITKNFRLFYTPEDQKAHLPESLLAEAAKNGKVIAEGWRVGKNLNKFWTSEVITAIHDEKNRVIGFVKISRNATEGKREEERFRLVVESAPNAMVLVNHVGKITLVNGQTEKLFGYSRDELIDHPVEILVPQRLSGQHPHYRNSF